MASEEVDEVKNEEAPEVVSNEVMKKPTKLYLMRLNPNKKNEEVVKK